MKNRRNYYRILCVQPDAPAEVIKASYRALMQALKMHPDLGGDHTQAAFINEAFAALGDPVRRAAYDRLQKPLSEMRARKAAPRLEAPAPPAQRPPAPPPSPAARCAFCGASCPAGDLEFHEAICQACESPLFMATRHSDGERSRRAMSRVPRNMPMTLRVAASPQRIWPGATDDVSLNGMGVLSAVELSPGERLRIECEFCSAVGIIKTVRPDAGNARRWHYGVEFLRLYIKHERGGLFSTVA